MRVSRSYVASFALALSACAPDIDVDPDETLENLPNFDPGPAAEFDPAASVIPFPNNLLIDPATGRVNLPPQCGETPAAAALRTNVLNTLNGFGTSFTTIRATFSAPVDPASLTGNAFLYRIQTGGVPVAPGSEPAVELMPVVGTTIRYTGSGEGCLETGQPVNAVTFIPTTPLWGDSTYGMYLLEGISSTDGELFQPTITWALVRQSNPVVVFDESGNVVTNLTPLDPANPADLAQLQGLDVLTKAHASLLAFGDAVLPEDRGRADVLLAWSFNTESIERIFNPEIPGTPGANISTSTPNAATVTSLGAPATVMAGALGAGICATMPCAAIGSILGGGFVSPRYQTLGEGGVPGPFSDPIAPAQQGTETLSFIAFTPNYDETTSVNGAPTVLFGHGLGSSKEALFAIGAQLAAAGFNAVAIDWVAHGDRAVRISTDAATGCAGDPDPTEDAQCFAPFLSTDLARTRDNVRQSVIDMWKLTEVLKACGTTDACGGLKVDVNRMSYVGQSLGGMIGTIVVAVVPELTTAVLNAPAVSFTTIFENTETNAIKCPVIDALIASGVLVGEPWSLGTDLEDPSDDTGLCTTATWQAQPGYQSFAATARWVLDPADGINFARFIVGSGKTLLVQEIVGDRVLPNESTELLTQLLGLEPTNGVVATSATPEPTAAATSMESSWILYVTQAPDGGAFPGNMYEHPSLLRPAEGMAGQLGTAQMQTDAITFLGVNL